MARSDNRGRTPISAEESRLIQEIVQDYCGVTYGLDSAFFLERRLAPRLERLGLSSYTEYHRFLRSGPDGRAEIANLVEHITTHETYFFREEYQLRAFREEVLPELHRRLRAHRRLSIWSAGCSTGEEVYTLAMIMLQDPRFEEWSVRVVGSDISRKVLGRARAGTYRAHSFRTTDPEYVSRYFAEKEGAHTVCDAVRSMCSFAQLNLMDVDRYRVLGSCHVVFCRNVLMYLSASARARVVDAFYDLLAPGGWLLLGHSESLLSVPTRFELAQLEKDLVYRKPESG